LYHCALRIDLVRPHWQVAIILALFRLILERGRLIGTCIVVCHPGRRVLFDLRCVALVDIHMYLCLPGQHCGEQRLHLRTVAYARREIIVPRTGEAQSTVCVAARCTTVSHSSLWMIGSCRSRRRHSCYIIYAYCVYGVCEWLVLTRCLRPHRCNNICRDRLNSHHDFGLQFPMCITHGPLRARMREISCVPQCVALL